jgi:hypothetical protein
VAVVEEPLEVLLIKRAAEDLAARLLLRYLSQDNPYKLLLALAVLLLSRAHRLILFRLGLVTQKLAVAVMAALEVLLVLVILRAPVVLAVAVAAVVGDQVRHRLALVVADRQ